jgi:pimeloyl-ACP methyl ester carboxylesterase
MLRIPPTSHGAHIAARPAFVAPHPIVARHPPVRAAELHTPFPAPLHGTSARAQRIQSTFAVPEHGHDAVMAQPPDMSSELETESEVEVESSEQQMAEKIEAIGTEPLANFEAVVEQIANGMMYKDGLDAADQHFLKVNGYEAMPVIRGQRSLVMRVFVPIEEGKPPIVAFRGTVPTIPHTVIADLDPGGIGMYQFTPNLELISAHMHAAASFGPVLTTGHSLGGALAQIAAAKFSDIVGSIVTFQSPGVPRETARAVETHNQENPDQVISSSHHRVAGDLVPSGGQALTPGTIHNHELSKGNALDKHLVRPLAQEELAAGNVLPNQGTESVTATGDVSVETDNAEKSQVIELARAGLGTLVYGPSNILIGIRDAAGHVISATGHVLVKARDAAGNVVIGIVDAAGNIRDAVGNLLRKLLP